MTENSLDVAAGQFALLLLSDRKEASPYDIYFKTKMGQKGRLLNTGTPKSHERCLIYNAKNVYVDLGSETVGFMMINLPHGSQLEYMTRCTGNFSIRGLSK